MGMGSYKAIGSSIDIWFCLLLIGFEKFWLIGATGIASLKLLVRFFSYSF